MGIEHSDILSEYVADYIHPNRLSMAEIKYDCEKFPSGIIFKFRRPSLKKSQNSRSCVTKYVSLYGNGINLVCKVNCDSHDNSPLQISMFLHRK